MDLTAASAGQAIADVPVGTMIADLGLGIAAAQRALDRNSIDTASAMMFEKLRIRGVEKSLLELGFTPSFYHFTEATLDVNVSVTMRVAEISTFGLGLSVSGGVDIGKQPAKPGTTSPGTTPPGGTAPPASGAKPPAGGTAPPASGGTAPATSSMAAATTDAQPGRCVAITAEGKQCSRNAAEGSDRCTQHRQLSGS